MDALIYGLPFSNPFGIRTFIIGLDKFLRILSEHPSVMDDKIKNPVLILLDSFELIKEITASNKIP